MFERVNKICGAETDDLRELCRIAGGDPKSFYVGSDFRHADLCGVDLRGFDLRNSDFTNARFDHNTRVDSQFDSILRSVGSDVSVFDPSSIEPRIFIVSKDSVRKGRGAGLDAMIEHLANVFFSHVSEKHILDYKSLYNAVEEIRKSNLSSISDLDIVIVVFIDYTRARPSLLKSDLKEFSRGVREPNFLHKLAAINDSARSFNLINVFFANDRDLGYIQEWSLIALDQFPSYFNCRVVNKLRPFYVYEILRNIGYLPFEYMCLLFFFDLLIEEDWGPALNRAAQKAVRFEAYGKDSVLYLSEVSKYRFFSTSMKREYFSRIIEAGANMNRIEFKKCLNLFSLILSAVDERNIWALEPMLRHLNRSTVDLQDLIVGAIRQMGSAAEEALPQLSRVLSSNNDVRNGNIASVLTEISMPESISAIEKG